MVSSVIGSPSISASSSCRSLSAVVNLLNSLAGEVTLAEIELRGSPVVERDLDPAELAVEILSWSCNSQ